MAENTEQYMPSEQGVRAGYVWLSAGDNEGAREVAEADFDRWLAVHDARVRSEVLAERAERHKALGKTHRSEERHEAARAEFAIMRAYQDDYGIFVRRIEQEARR